MVAAAAQSGFVSAAAVRARCEMRGGSFFKGVSPGADAYLMKYILHDWTDEQSHRILGHCRRHGARAAACWSWTT